MANDCPPIKLVFNYFRVLAQLGLIYPLASFQPWAPARIERYFKIAKFLKAFWSLLWCDFLETDFWEDIYYSFYFVGFMVESSNVKIQWTWIKEPVAFLYTHKGWRWPGICILVWLRIYINLNEPCYKFILRACTIYLHLNLNV